MPQIAVYLCLNIWKKYAVEEKLLGCPYPSRIHTDLGEVFSVAVNILSLITCSRTFDESDNEFMVWKSPHWFPLLSLVWAPVFLL